MNVKTLIACAAGVVALGSVPAGAVELHMDEAPATEARTIDDDYLFMGESLGMTGAVESLYFFGETLTFTGRATGNLVAAAGTLVVEGDVSDDTMLAARTLTIGGRLADTSFVAAETLTMLPAATVGGALFAAAGDVRIDGTLEDDLLVAGREVLISGIVEGDVRAHAKELRIAPDARIVGDLTYSSDRELGAEELARVGGTVRIEEPDPERDYRAPWFLRLAPWVGQLVVLLSGLAFTLLVYLFPGFRGVDTARNGRRFWVTIAWGLIPFFAYPILIGALFLAGFAFGITVPVALSLVFSLGVLAYVLGAFALPQIGVYVRMLIGRSGADATRRGAPFTDALIGFVPVLVLGMIPILNGFVFILVTSLGWGMAIERMFNVRLGGAAAA